MQVGDLFDLELFEHEVAGQRGLGIVIGHGAEEERVLAVFSQTGRGGCGRHRDKGCFLEHGQRSLGGAGANGADNSVDFFRNQFGGRIGGHFGFALVVLRHNFNGAAKQTALGVGLIHNDFYRVQAGNAVRSQVAGLSPLHADLDGISSLSRRGQRHADSHCGKPCHTFFHLPLLRENCARRLCTSY